MNLEVNCKPEVFIFAGEKSGDLHGSHLIKSLRKYQPDIEFKGISGPKMRAEGVFGPCSMEEFEVMGFSDVVLALPRLYRNFCKIRNDILSKNPQAAILIDYPGFNLRLAKALRKGGYQGKLIQFVSPSVWAWGKHRISTMASSLDLLLSIFPFEMDYFSKSSLRVSYVGNPLSEYITNYHYDNTWREKLDIPLNGNLIGLFPGSRENEIKRNLPIILKAAKLYREKYPNAIFGVSCSHDFTENYLNILIQNEPEIWHPCIFPIPKDFTYELMRDSRSAIAKSGTVTLELALHECPTVVIYKLTKLNKWYAQHILKVQLPHYCIVNILANHRVFPELIENELNPRNIVDQLETIDIESRERLYCIQDCKKIKSLLCQYNASEQAAKNILNLLFQC